MAKFPRKQTLFAITVLSFIFVLFTVLGCGGGGGTSGNSNSKTYQGYVEGYVYDYLGKNLDKNNAKVGKFSVSSVNITWNNNTATTNSNGYYRINNIPTQYNGVSTITLVISGEYINSGNITMNTPWGAEWGQGGTTQNINVTYKNTGSLYISSSPSNAQINMYNIDLLYDGYSDYYSGTTVLTPILLSEVPVSSGWVYVKKTGYYQTATQTITIEANKQTNLNFNLTPLP